MKHAFDIGGVFRSSRTLSREAVLGVLGLGATAPSALRTIGRRESVFIWGAMGLLGALFRGSLEVGVTSCEQLAHIAPKQDRVR